MKKLKKPLVILLGIFALILLQSLPIFFLKNPFMQKLETENAIIFYDHNDVKSAKLISEKLDDTFTQIKLKLRINSSDKASVYIYKKQSSLHIRKYGLLTLLFSPNWFIGDNRKTNALIVSPYADVAGHNQDSILYALSHEIVHTFNYSTNPNLSYFIDNGVATYLSNQKPTENFRKRNENYPIENMRNEDELFFGESGGYNYSYTYIQFIDEVYG